MWAASEKKEKEEEEDRILLDEKERERWERRISQSFRLAVTNFNLSLLLCPHVQQAACVLPTHPGKKKLFSPLSFSFFYLGGKVGTKRGALRGRELVVKIGRGCDHYARNSFPSCCRLGWLGAVAEGRREGDFWWEGGKEEEEEAT